MQLQCAEHEAIVSSTPDHVVLETLVARTGPAESVDPQTTNSIRVSSATS